MNSTITYRQKEWKRRSGDCVKECGKGFLYQLTPCVNCANTTSATCTAHKGPPNHQCVVLHYEYAYAHTTFPSTYCSNTTCTYPMHCSVYQEDFIVYPSDMNTTVPNDFCLADKRSGRKYMYLIFALVFISVGAFICFTTLRRACSSRKTPPVISNGEPETT